MSSIESGIKYSYEQSVYRRDAKPGCAIWWRTHEPGPLTKSVIADRKGHAIGLYSTRLGSGTMTPEGSTLERIVDWYDVRDLHIVHIECLEAENPDS